MKNDEHTLTKWLDQYTIIVENGDFESYKSLWTDNVIWMPSNAPNLIGKQAISDFAEPYFSQYNIEYKPTIEEIKVISDFAYLRFSVIEKYTPKVGNTEPLVVIDKDLFLLRKESDGRWVATHGIWNEGKKSKTKIEEKNKALLRRYYTELDKTNIENLDDFLNKFISHDFILHLPGDIDIRGKEGLKKYYSNSMKAFFNRRHLIDEVIAENDKVAFRATSRAIHQGAFMNIPPSDNEIKVTFDGFWKVQDELIVEWWSEYDSLSMMQQLGMELKMKEENE